MPGARQGIGPPNLPDSRASTGTLYRHRAVEASRRAQRSPNAALIPLGRDQGE